MLRNARFFVFSPLLSLTFPLPHDAGKYLGFYHLQYLIMASVVSGEETGE